MNTEHPSKDDIQSMVDDTTIHRSGGSTFINPGTGAVRGATEENACLNMGQLITDCHPLPIYFIRDSKSDYGEGRYAFSVHHRNHTNTVEVQMPGWALDKVRYMNEPGQNVWHFPRLYVDGSSWIWEIAISCVKKGWDEPGADDPES